MVIKSMTVQQVLEALEGMDWQMDVVFCRQIRSQDGRMIIRAVEDIGRVQLCSDERGEFVAVMT